MEVGGVGETVGGSSEDLEEIICSFDSAVAGVVGVVPGEDLVGPGESSCVPILPEVEAVEFLECLPAGPEPRVGVEEGVEAGPVCVCECVASA